MGFYDVLAAQKRIELTEQLVKTTKQSSDLTERLLTAQQISQSDLLQSQVETEEARVLADNAQNQSAEAWRRLKAVVGLPELEGKTLSGQLDSDIPIYDWNEAYSNVLGQSPELSAAQSRIQRARWAIQRSRRENVPNVDVMVSASHRNQTGDDVAGVQVGIPIPICNRNQGNIMAADADLIAAENDVRRIQLSLQQRLATTISPLRQRASTGGSLQERDSTSGATIDRFSKPRLRGWTGRLPCLFDQSADLRSRKSHIS